MKGKSAMGYYAETVEVDFTILAEAVPAALAAVLARFGGEHATLADAVEWNTSFEGCEDDPGAGFTLGWHNEKYLSDTEALLATLAPFARNGSYVRFHGEDGSLFGSRIVDGRLRDEWGDYTWTLQPVPAEHVTTTQTT
jgi:hypothetical protein